MASTAQEQDVFFKERIDEITAGPFLVKLENMAFFIHKSALDALKALDQRCGVTTPEKKIQGLEFNAWRCLDVPNMKLRLEFYSDASDSSWNRVNVFGLKKKDNMRRSYFDGPAAYDCYLRFLDGFVLSQHNAHAVAMGQHVRLGSESLLSILPEALFRSLVQPHLSTLEHWDFKKEEALKAVIKLQEFEVTKGLLNDLVVAKSSDTTGELFFYDICNMYAACVGMDQRFGEHTGEADGRHTFDATRRLTTNERTIRFIFTYDRYGQSYIHVRGLGQVEGLASDDLDDQAFVFFLDTLLRHGTNHYYEVTTRE
jgi:hypothetical protein